MKRLETTEIAAKKISFIFSPWGKIGIQNPAFPSRKIGKRKKKRITSTPAAEFTQSAPFWIFPVRGRDVRIEVMSRAEVNKVKTAIFACAEWRVTRGILPWHWWDKIFHHLLLIFSTDEDFHRRFFKGRVLLFFFDLGERAMIREEGERGISDFFWWNCERFSAFSELGGEVRGGSGRWRWGAEARKIRMKKCKKSLFEEKLYYIILVLIYY